MTSQQIRQSFLDFFRSKQHTIVPSSSLMPDSPNLLFTNAGMNRFVPIFLGEQKADVDKWAGAIPGLPTRAADTQKCIRAGGKHNDLEDVGLDTYHHTFFEMLGNWSFGDYFKKEAIEWAWELVTGVWKFPKERLYATVYQPGPGEPSEFDQEAHDHWARLFTAAGLDPKVHICTSGKKDNFWMMGETGPCGPCSELHFDLTPAGDTQGKLVNAGSSKCIEIWNLVFIQFNAEPDGPEEAAKMILPNAKAGETWRQRFVPLPAKHVDTGMGFERVTSIIQGTNGFAEFTHAKISNYETDIFRPIFDALEKLSGKKYASTLPDGPNASSEFPGEHTRPRVSQSAPPPIASEASGNATGTAGSLGDNEHAAPTAGAQSATREGACAPRETSPEQIQTDVAFRVIADHIRTLGFAIADGIQPGNTDRNYVLRRILRRAVRYGRTLGFHEPFFYKLVDVLSDTMGGVVPEIREKKTHVQEVIRVEEEAFNKTLDSGLELFDLVMRRRDQLSHTVDGLAPRLHTLRDEFAAVPLKRDAIFEFKVVHGRKFNELVKATIQIGHQDFGRFFGLEALHLLGTAKRLKNTGPTDTELAFADDSLARRKITDLFDEFEETLQRVCDQVVQFPGRAAFVLYDTYGFPLDLTELMARERGLTVDKDGFNRLMDEQKKRSQAAQKRQVIELSQIETTTSTNFVGYDKLETPSKVLEVVGLKDKTAVVLDVSPMYAEMGGQVGDTGELEQGDQLWRITNTQKSGDTWLHFVEEGVEQPASLSRPAAGRTERESALASSSISERTDDSPTPVGGSPTGRGGSPVLPLPGSTVTICVDRPRREAIQRHHTVTHLFHWALHEVVSREASQKGSYVGPDKLTFDFNSAPLTTQQVADIEWLVNERILENAGVSWTEVPYDDVRNRKDVMQFFGDKYGDTVRVVQIGGRAGELDGYSMELCGGTHTRATGEIGLFRIVGESAIAAGVRRIEAIAGLEAYQQANSELELVKSIAGKVNTPVGELEKKIESLLAHQKELEKALKSAKQREAAQSAKSLVVSAETVNGIQLITRNLGEADGETLQTVADALKGEFKGVVALGGVNNGTVVLLASVSPDLTKRVQAGKIIQAIAPIVGGKGGGRPDNARGGGKDAGKLDEALARVKSLLG